MQDWIRPGARCVCIEADWPELTIAGESLPVRVPMLHEVLTIREARPWQPSALSGDPGGIFLTFWEIAISQRAGAVTAQFRWHACAFRPLQQRDTDIAALTSLLDRSPATLTEDA